MLVWWHERAPGLGLGALFFAVVIAFAGGDFEFKLIFFGSIFAFAFATSFIRLPARDKLRVWKLDVAEAASRAIDRLPAQGAVDRRRPLLAVGAARRGGSWIYLIVLPDTGDEAASIRAVPNYKWGREPKELDFSSYAELRQNVESGILRMVTQGRFSDNAGAHYFGADWREP